MTGKKTHTRAGSHRYACTIKYCKTIFCRPPAHPKILSL